MSIQKPYNQNNIVIIKYDYNGNFSNDTFREKIKIDVIIFIIITYFMEKSSHHF